MKKAIAMAIAAALAATAAGCSAASTARQQASWVRQAAINKYRERMAMLTIG